MVTLEEVTKANLGEVLRAKVSPAQDAFVANNAISIAQAYFEPAAWFRAIYVGGQVVGFVMVSDPTLPGATPEPGEAQDFNLWRFLIAADHQRKGYGRAALDALVAHARTRPGLTRMTASYVDAPGGPEAFYLGYGFKATGRLIEEEVEVALPL